MASASPSAPAAGPSVEPPGPAPRSRGWGRRRVVAIAIAAMVVAGGILGAIVLLRPAAGPLPPTFAEARSQANTSVANVSGGDWTLLSATGLDERSGAPIPVDEFATAAGIGCGAGAVTGHPLPSSLSVPSYGGSFGAGRAPFWLFLFRQSASGPFLLTDVDGGAAAPLAYLTGAGCDTNLSSISPIAAGIADSPIVAGTAWSSPDVNASAFVATDPSLTTLAMLATGGFKVGTETFKGWALEYAPCSPFVTGPANETTFDVLFDSTGTLLYSFAYHADCPAS